MIKNYLGKILICSIFFSLHISIFHTCFAEEIPEVTVIWDKSKQNMPSVLWDTTPKISDTDLAYLQKKIDKMNSEQAKKACEEAVANWLCLWIKLNTNFPFLWNCIKTRECWEDATTPVNAFPKLMWALMNLLMTVILIMSLLMIVYSWVLMTTWWYSTSNYTKGIWLLWQVAKWMALLWASWVILKVINPNFFV